MSAEPLRAVPGDDTPHYHAAGREVEAFAAAHRAQLPVLLTGPTGSGKTRFVEYMAHCLGRELITVAAHEDLTAADLVGRHLLRDGDTMWEDGPLTHAVRVGGICYLDEVVEARQDTTVVIHPLTDHRRILTVDRRGETLAAPPTFTMVMSYNPGYQSVLKDLKESTRQRFVTIALDHAPAEVETMIVAREAGVDDEVAASLVELGTLIRRLDAPDLREVASTRTLVAAAKLVREGLPWRDAVEVAVVAPVADAPALRPKLAELADAADPS